jgi:hypothetical protein
MHGEGGQAFNHRDNSMLSYHPWKAVKSIQTDAGQARYHVVLRVDGSRLDSLE